MHTRLLALVGVLVMSSCVSSTPMDVGTSCEPGTACRVEGRLAVESKWQASLDLAQSCFALAVPESFYVTHKHLDGKHVLVLGEAFSQPPDSPGTISYGYEVSGMRVNANLCDFAILVDEIRSGDEVLWLRTKMVEP